METETETTMDIFVVVENVPAGDMGEYDECIAQGLGYFTDENEVEEVVNKLNKKYNKEHVTDYEDDDTPRFGFLPLQKHK